MSKECSVCGWVFTKRRPNSCMRCYFKKRHQERYQKKSRKCRSCDQHFELGHNVYCDTCKDNVLKCDPNHRIYFGRKFYRAINDYWVCCTARLPWAHRWVWINMKGEIPKGFDIHHKDGNKDNNEIDNLELITRSEHQKKHWDQGDHDHEIEMRKEVLAKYRKRKT